MTKIIVWQSTLAEAVAVVVATSLPSLLITDEHNIQFLPKARPGWVLATACNWARSLFASQPIYVVVYYFVTLTVT